MTPLLIIGPPRSGTTWIARELAHRLDLPYFEELNPIWRLGNSWRRTDVLDPSCATPHVVRRIRNSFLRSIRQNRQLGFVEKTPANIVRQQFVRKVFPDAFYVCLVRSIHDVRSSWTRKVFEGEDRNDRRLPGNSAMRGRFSKLRALTASEVLWNFDEYALKAASALKFPVKSYLAPRIEARNLWCIDHQAYVENQVAMFEQGMKMYSDFPRYNTMELDYDELKMNFERVTNGIVGRYKKFCVGQDADADRGCGPRK